MSYVYFPGLVSMKSIQIITALFKLKCCMKSLKTHPIANSGSGSREINKMYYKLYVVCAKPYISCVAIFYLYNCTCYVSYFAAITTL